MVPGWRVAAVLALPFLIVVAALQGLTETLPTYHGIDEFTYHLPTIEGFADELPGVDLVDYPAAQTPLFHLLVALWGKVVGMEIWRLRVLEVVVSYVAVLAVYAMLRRHRAFEVWPAAALALLFGLSPYVFGQSFILVTDNLGLLLCVLAVERLLAWQQRRSWGVFAAACGWIALALLTRQSYVWLPLVAFAVVLVAPNEGRRLWAGPRELAPAVGLLALAAVPLVALFVAWRGLVPVGGDPASCGLCNPDEGRLGWGESSPLRAPLFTVGLVGLYGTLLLGRSFAGEVRGWFGGQSGAGADGAGGADSGGADAVGAVAGGAGAGRSGRPGWVAPAVGAAVGVALLLAVPLVYGPARGDEGFLWRLSRIGPELLGSGLVFWALVPLGCAVLVMWVRRDGWRSLPLLLLGCFLAAQLATRLSYQKYFDPFVLLALLLALRPQWLRTRADWIGPVLVVALSLAYALAFVVGLIDAQT